MGAACSRDNREKDLPPTTPPHHLFYRAVGRFSKIDDIVVLFFISTVRKHGHNVVLAIENAPRGQPFIPLATETQPE